MVSISISKWFGAGSLLGLLFLAGCGAGLPDADDAIAQKILLFGNGSEPKGIDPHLVTGVPENHIVSALLEGLITYHLTDDMQPEPGVAERWEHNADFSVWTFHLRAEARWTNGDPVTAGDFVYSFRRMLTPELGAEYAQMLYILRGAEAFHTGAEADFAKVGVKALDAQTLQLSLVGPTPYFLNMLKHYSWFPVHPPTVETHGGMLDRSGRWTRPETFVGNGPFALSVWKPNQYLKVTKSPTYWDADVVGLEGIIYFPIEDENTEARMFAAGKLHYTSTVPTNTIPQLRQRSPELIHLDPYLGTYFYRLNVNVPPLDNPKVRAALNWALDRGEIVSKVTLGGEIPATTMVPAMMHNYASIDRVGFDPAKAQALLAEAGFPGGEGLPPIELLYNTSEGHKKIAEAVAAMWQRTLGITVRLTNKEWKVYLEEQNQLNYTISRSGWIADYVDPISFLDMWTTGNGNNDTGWSNAEYDALIRKAVRSGSEAEHFESLRAAEAILMRELPIVPIYWYTRKFMLDPRVKNWFPKVLDNRPYKYVYLEGAAG